jgi:hypothetical protein
MDNLNQVVPRRDDGSPPEFITVRANHSAPRRTNRTSEITDVNRLYETLQKY